MSYGCQCFSKRNLHTCSGNFYGIGDKIFFFLGLLKLSGYICCFMTLNLSLHHINSHISLLVCFNMSMLVMVTGAFGCIRHGGIYG